MSTQTTQHDPLDVRTEYTALTSFHTSVVTYRFTLLGFFIASVGIMAGGKISLDKAFLLLGVTVAMYIIELRNRVLYYELTQRAMQIERQNWGYKGDEAYKPFFCYLAKVKPSSADDPEAKEPPQFNHPKVWDWVVHLPASHTKGLDVLYAVIAIYSIAHIIGHFCH
ncbi:MAG: hypothetical protein ABIK83_04185 [Candidatus Zixiibacteriota bacterium]